jgi:hypothetical protein
VTKKTEIPDWETLLAHAALLQAKIPAAILVGGTAAAVHAGHRISCSASKASRTSSILCHGIARTAIMGQLA